MIKLYFKKLLSTALYTIGFFGIILFELFFMMFIPPKWRETIICYIVVILIALYSLLRVIYAGRLDKIEIRKLFVREMRKTTFSFGADLKRTVTSKDNLMQMLAFMTVVFLFDAPIAINAGVPFYGYVIGMIPLLAVTGVLFSVFNALLWYVVHRRWMKN